MEAYQKAYQQYTAIVQNPNCSTTQRDAAIKNLQTARDRYEALKAAAGQ
jgi:aspartate-semialdehyde dehydrogenase